MYSDEAIFNRRLTKNYHIARVLCPFALSVKLWRKRLLLVYQMGKVGSTSVVRSLKAATFEKPVLQVHALSSQGIAEMERRYYGHRRALLQRSYLPETTHLFTSYYLQLIRRLTRNSPHWKIVTLVRDPLARNVSEFFYSVDTNKSNPYLPDFYERHAANAITDAEIFQRFMQLFHVHSSDFHLPLRWFDREFADVTGIDVYGYDFPKKRGYRRYHSEGYDVLLLKLESLGHNFRQAFGEFLRLPDLQLKKENLATHKRYYPAYKAFVDSVSFPTSYLDQVYSSKYVRHFYTDEEIDGFRRKWQ